jgi:hypothetical protein
MTSEPHEADDRGVSRLINEDPVNAESAVPKSCEASSVSRADFRAYLADKVESTFPHYDVRQGARTYASIGGTLAGFSFAAVVLLARLGADCSGHPISSFCRDPAAIRDTAAAAFLIAFFGCVSGAFVFAITGAEELLSKRAHSMAFFGSTGFVLGIGHAFWGLALLAHLFLNAGHGTAVVVANLMVIGVAFTAPALVAFPALHIKSAFAPVPTKLPGLAVADDDAPPQGRSSKADQGSAGRKPRVSWGDWCRAFVPGYVVVACGIAGVFIKGSQLDGALKQARVFSWIFGSAWALAVIGLLGTLLIGARSLKFSVRPIWAGVWAAFHAGLLWTLVLLLPPFP